MDTGRLKGLDDIRGLGILGVVFLHSATFHYQGLTVIDMDNPPLLITVIGFLLMWAGLFAIISGAAYAYTAARRLAGERAPGQWFRHLAVAGGVALALHYIYFLVLAPPLLDLEHGAHQYALLPGLIVSGRFPPLHAERLFYSTTLSMIGWNLILTGALLSFLARRGRPDGRIVGALGALILVISLVRIPLYPLAVRAVEQRAFLPALIWGFLVNKNNPVLPYLGFGLLGTSLGLALAETRRPGRVLGGLALLGLLWLIAGLVGLLSLPDTMLEREIDLFWYFLMFLQVGLFLLLVTSALAVEDLWGVPRLGRLLRPVRRLGTVSLSVFMFETVLSQLLVRVGDAFWPGWRLSIEACLAFGAFNVLLWIALVALWARAGFRCSVEQCIVHIYRWFRRPSARATAQQQTALAGHHDPILRKDQLV